MTEADQTSADDVSRVKPGVKDALIGAALGLLIIYLGTLIPFRILRWPTIGIGALFVVVMTAFVGVFVWKTIAGVVAPVVGRARGHVRTDSHLGTLRRDARARCWVATCPVANRTIDVVIEGGDAPNARLLERAREIVAGFDVLERRVGEYLTREADSATAADAEVAAEIRRLRISAIHLRAPDRPNEAAIDFEGPDEMRVWTCEYVDGELSGLDYD